MERLLSFLIGYGFGSFLTATLVARVCQGCSIREIGSGNPGMANVMSHVGVKAGLWVLFGDFLKTGLALIVAFLCLGYEIGNASLWYAGLGAIFGHNFPWWNRFRGGKGVTVTCTWLMVILPGWGLLVCVIGGVLTILTGYLPLGAVVIPLLALPFAYAMGKEVFFVVLLSAAVMISRHYRGMGRIFRGEEERKFRKRNRIS